MEPKQIVDEICNCNNICKFTTDLNWIFALKTHKTQVKVTSIFLTVQYETQKPAAEHHGK